jgi:hypothetical protein
MRAPTELGDCPVALETLTLTPSARRRLTLDALRGLAQGDLAERLRLDAAARILGTVRRMAEDGVPAPRAALDWDPTLTTAREQAEAMTPAQVDALLAEAPRWAKDALAVPALRQAA